VCGEKGNASTNFSIISSLTEKKKKTIGKKIQKAIKKLRGVHFAK
jgi:hypothetical protein